MLSPTNGMFDKFFPSEIYFGSFKEKNIYCILVTVFSLCHSLLIWHGKELTVWIQCVKVACKVAVWHLVKSSKMARCTRWKRKHYTYTLPL